LAASPTTETYPLSLHDALPISRGQLGRSTRDQVRAHDRDRRDVVALIGLGSSIAVVLLHEAGYVSVWWLLASLSFIGAAQGSVRSEEHTSELQSRFDLVCRLLL